MRASLTIGKIAGIPIRIHLNWVLTAVLVVWSLAAGYFPQEYPGWGQALYWAIGALTALFFFASVLLHELGHALVALREKVPVNSITLFIFGGVAHIGSEPETPGAEFRIVAAGPATSLALAVFFHLVSWLAPFDAVSGPALYLGRINVILALFNLIPGFPLDGGRILRAILWKISQNYIRSTRWAAHAGLSIALLFVAGGLVLMFMGNMMPGLWVGFIGWYLSTAAQEGYRQASSEEAFEKAAASSLELPDRGFRAPFIPPKPPLAVLEGRKKPERPFVFDVVRFRPPAWAEVPTQPVVRRKEQENGMGRRYATYNLVGPADAKDGLWLPHQSQKPAVEPLEPDL